jgi:hypothetical protein
MEKYARNFVAAGDGTKAMLEYLDIFSPPVCGFFQPGRKCFSLDSSTEQ